MRKVIKILGMSLVFSLSQLSNVFAFTSFTLDSDLNYSFENDDTNEYYETGIQSLNYNGVVPDHISDIYDFTPQKPYNSDFGASIIDVDNYDGLPTSAYDKAPPNAPIENRNVGSPISTNSYGVNGVSAGTGTVSSGTGANATSTAVTYDNQGNVEYPNFTQEITGNINPNPYDITEIEDVRNEDGSIGRLKISSIKLNEKVYDGDTYEAMRKGLGHVNQTSVFTGNVGVVGHNRGSNDHLGDLKYVEEGDIITYETKLGTKTYKVNYVGKINETDWSMLSYTTDNRITLVTCVEDVPEKRLVVQGVEIIN